MFLKTNTKFLLRIFLIILGTVFLFPFNNLKGANSSSHFLVKITKENEVKTLIDISDDLKVKKITWIGEDSTGNPIFKIETDNVSDKKIQGLRKNHNLLNLEPDFKVEIQYTPNDPLFSRQWHLTKINIPSAWDYDKISPKYGGDSRIKVAVLDTGVAFENYGTYQKAPDLANTNFSSGYDFINDDSHPNDDNGHGTLITGVIAQSTNNNLGGAGISFNTTIIPIKVLDASGQGQISDIIEGLNYAQRQGAHIINMSFGTSNYSQSLYDTIKKLALKNIILVAASGNNGQSKLLYPAAFEEVIAVGATQYDNKLAPYSNYGSKLDLVAPGGNLNKDQNHDGYPDGILQESFDPSYSPPDVTKFSYVWAQGTSLAAPQVSGVAALLLAYGVESRNVAQILFSSATDLGDKGKDKKFGWGLLNAKDAFKKVAQDKYPPQAQITVNKKYTSSKNVTLHFKVTDKGTGVAWMRFSNNGKNWTSWQAYSSSKKWDITNPKYGGNSEEGSKKIYIQFKDWAGNKSSYSIKIIYDTTPPNVNIQKPSLNYSTKKKFVEFIGAVQDNISGISYLKINNQKIKLNSKGKFIARFKLKKGRNIFELEAKDKAGLIVKSTYKVNHIYKPKLVIGLSKGFEPQVRIFSPSGELLGVFLAYEKDFKGGVNVTLGDINRDGFDEIITAPGPGHSPEIKVFDFKGNLKYSFLAYDINFKGGVKVASGDTNKDFKDEIITSPLKGGGPHIRIFGLKKDNIEPLTLGFYAYDSGFRGGVNIACGDLDGDGKVEILTAPYSDREPYVRIFGRRGDIYREVILGFFAYDSSFNKGVSLTAGDLSGNNKDEIIVGPQDLYPAHLKIFGRKDDGKIYLLSGGFLAYDSVFQGGVNLASYDLNGDNKAEIIAGVHSKGAPLIKFLDGWGELPLPAFFVLPPSFSLGFSVAAGIGE